MKITERRLRQIIRSVIKESIIDRPDFISQNVDVVEGNRVIVNYIPRDYDNAARHGAEGTVEETWVGESGVRFCNVMFDDGTIKENIPCTESNITKL
tara:strand:+ start:70 stop:360 length:291 start_codon:yes stop_codon:yes gene_type:complete